MMKNDVGHDDDSVETSNCQTQPKEAQGGHVLSKSKNCNLCHPTSSEEDIFNDYYFCEKCMSQL